MKFSSILVVLVSILFFSACGSEEEKPEGNPYSTAAKEPSKGGKLFKQYCVQCHSLDKDKIGPALKGVFANWNYDTTRITAFIRNARETINAEDPRAVAVAEKWNYALMTPMPHLTDDDIKAILEYIAE